MRIPAYPDFPNSIMQRDDDLLDAYVAAYRSVGGSTSVERFLFGYLPLRVFESMLGEPKQGEVEKNLWLIYLSGYFGGRWLRGEIAKAQPEAMLVQFSLYPTKESFDNAANRTQLALSASDVKAAIASLWDTPVPDGEPIRGLADTFGYNAGYMLEILNSPPVGISVPVQYQVLCDRVMACKYNSVKLSMINDLEPVADALNRKDGNYATLYDELKKVQEDSIPRGRQVWSSGLSVQGFSQDAYDQLLDVSSSFLETVQATVLMTLRGIANDNSDDIQRGSRGNAAMVMWLASYMFGLLNGEGVIEIPSFA